MCNHCVGTRVYIYLSETWKSQGISGLCGNFDGRAGDDFCTGPGVCGTSASEFGISQKTNAACPESDHGDNYDPCDVSA